MSNNADDPITMGVDYYARVSTTEIHNSTSFNNLLTDENVTKRSFVYSEKENAYIVRNVAYKYIKTIMEQRNYINFLLMLMKALV
ncbi:MAG: hypothetical protein V3V28_05045 [Polaribacter sp.]|uniref:hypothetical protein n=1 Tax=Polaribacter sp. TaxID=1920175 RepID=UPI002F351CCA